MKYSELEAELKAAGCFVVRKGGNHRIWFSPITEKKFPLGHHGAKTQKTEVRQILLHET